MDAAGVAGARPLAMGEDEAYRRIRAEVEHLAGRSADIVHRSVLMHAVYRDSGDNFTFAELVAHAGLRFAPMFSLDRNRMVSRMGGLGGSGLQDVRTFFRTLRRANRMIFVDTLTAYLLTRSGGVNRAAGSSVPPALLDSLARIHEAARLGRTLTAGERGAIFDRFFLREQLLVDPLVRRAYGALGTPGLGAIARRPAVRLAFMTGHVRYGDFTSLEQRLRNGRIVYAAADRAGWPQVTRALACYSASPPDLEARAEWWRRKLERVASPARPGARHPRARTTGARQRPRVSAAEGGDPPARLEGPLRRTLRGGDP